MGTEEMLHFYGPDVIWLLCSWTLFSGSGSLGSKCVWQSCMVCDSLTLLKLLPTTIEHYLSFQFFS